MTHYQQIEAAAKAEDTLNLLDHLAWTDTIKPRLLVHKSVYERMLIEAVLGQKPQLANGQVLTSEQLAGRVYGINYLIDTFEDILRKGAKALDHLQVSGITVDNSRL